MDILITGGSGFIGTYLIKFFLEKVDSVHITNLDLNEPKVNDDRVISHLIDIRDVKQLNELLIEKHDLCIHLAALCKEPGFEWREYFHTNYLGTVNVLNLCRKLDIRNVVFTSTMMVFKSGEIRNLDDSITDPDTAYGISKLLAEKELEKWKMENPVRTFKTIRPAVVFGRGENGNFDKLLKTLQRGFFPYVGKKSTIKSNIYVKELILFINFLMISKTQKDTFNFAFPEEASIKSIINAFRKVFDLRVFSPVLPFSLLLCLSYIFEFLNSIGLKNGIHHRRIEKLYYSSNIVPENSIQEGYVFKYDFESALQDWKEELNND